MVAPSRMIEDDLSRRFALARQEVAQLRGTVSELNAWILMLQEQMNGLRNRLTAFEMSMAAQPVIHYQLVDAMGANVPMQPAFRPPAPVALPAISPPPPPPPPPPQPEIFDPELQYACPGGNCICVGWPHGLRREWHNLDYNFGVVAEPRRGGSAAGRPTDPRRGVGRPRRATPMPQRTTPRTSRVRSVRQAETPQHVIVMSEAEVSVFSTVRQLVPEDLADVVEIDSVGGGEAMNGAVGDDAAERAAARNRAEDQWPTCRICLDKFFLGERLRELRCAHLFHGQCIVRWAETSKLCPICRQAIDGEATRRVGGAGGSGGGPSTSAAAGIGPSTSRA